MEKNNFEVKYIIFLHTIRTPGNRIWRDNWRRHSFATEIINFMKGFVIAKLAEWYAF